MATQDWVTTGLGNGSLSGSTKPSLDQTLISCEFNTMAGDASRQGISRHGIELTSDWCPIKISLGYSFSTFFTTASKSITWENASGCDVFSLIGEPNITFKLRSGKDLVSSGNIPLPAPMLTLKRLGHLSQNVILFSNLVCHKSHIFIWNWTNIINV